MLADAIAPGSGLATSTGTAFPIWPLVAVYAACNSVGETTVVATLLPPTWIDEPVTKPIPVTSSRKLLLVGPAEVEVAAVTVGTGFQIISVWLAVTTGVVWLRAVMATLPEAGIAGGGVYRPEVEIVPVSAAPPVTPFTCQVTAVFVTLLTVAVSWIVVPRRAWLLPAITT